MPGPFLLDLLVTHAQQAAAAGEHHPVLLSGLFILDLLVIHPFGDGNGRVSRLLAGALLGEHGYTVGRYVSLEQAIAESADAYCQALLDSARTPGTKQERIREHILRHAPATFRLADIRTAVPGVSDQTIRLVLEQLHRLRR